jgi:argininosuccinate lyase
MWGGRFDAQPDEAMRRFNDSFRFDRRLYAVDIRGSIAYARALARAGILTDDERDAIINGLGQVRDEFEAGSFTPQPTDEDIHTAVERRLTDLIGPVAGKLHTGRSRNDQVALDLRLWVLDAIDALDEAIKRVQRAMLTTAEAGEGAIMAGYTHLQPAQPVLFSHWVLSFFWMLDRDRQRLADCRARTAVSPLGSGALSGTPLDIDRAALAADLGLYAISANSLDAVSDRDFVAELLFALSLLGVHLSRFAEDVIIYMNKGWVHIGEGYTTGSSLMPQKRNPDSLELTRGKAGRVIGHLMGLLTTLKGLPTAYNKDLQEDKEPLFDAVDTFAVLLGVLAGVVSTLEPNADAMQAELDDFMLATDLSDYLVARGMPFREAHHAVGQVVKHAEAEGISLSAVPLGVMQGISPLFAADVADVFDWGQAVARRKAEGGTAPEAIRAQIKRARGTLA